MKSAKQTEQKVAAVEATLLQRRQYLESIKDCLYLRTEKAAQDALADTARRNELVAWRDQNFGSLPRGDC